MLFDGDKKYPESVVKYTKFRDHELRQMFTYLRQKELFYQSDIRRSGDRIERALLRAKLEEVEAHLIWMSHNVTGSAIERSLRRWGGVS